MRRQKAEPGVADVAATFVDFSRDGVIAFDLAGRIIVWNRAAVAMTGVAAERALGSALARTAPWLASGAGGRAMGTALEGVASISRLQYPIGEDGANGTLDVCWQPLTDGGGAVRGGLAILSVVDRLPDSPDSPAAAPQMPAVPGLTLQPLIEAFEALDHGFAIYDADRRLRLCNTTYRELLGGALLDHSGTTLDALVRNSLVCGALPDVDDSDALVHRLLEGHAPASRRVVEKRLRDDRWVATSRYLLSGGWTAALRVDITERKRREAALRANEERFRVLAEATFEGILVHEADRIVDANQALVELLGYSRDELMALDTWRLVAPAIQSAAAEGVRPQTDAQPVDQPCELVMRRKDGSTFPAEIRGKAVHYQGKPARVVAMRDISARKRNEDYIRRLAHHDSLTELPNRSLFLDRLALAMAQARRDGRPMAILQLDLDHFKDVNDTLGHHAGDALLRACARRLQSIVHDTDTVARIGGDEFAVILTGLERPFDAGHVAQRIIERLLEPIACQGHEVHTGTSIGITIFPDDDTDPDQLLRNADIALYRAKANGRNTYSFFVESMKRQLERRKEMEAELRRAIAGREFILHYQPQINLADGRVVGMEALMRWHHPMRGLVMPNEFLSIAEDAGLIVPIGLEILGQACAQARAWLDAGLDFGRVAINLAPAQFKARNLAYAVDDALQAAGLDSEHIGIEVSEGAFLGRNSERVAETLARLHEMNVQIALDDFGKGYASLGHLKEFPIDRLKIDRSLVRDIGVDPENTAIVRTVISLGRSLGMEVLAEGVETEDQREFLCLHRCDGAQGYLFGRPLPAAEAWHYLDSVGPDAQALSGSGR